MSRLFSPLLSFYSFSRHISHNSHFCRIDNDLYEDFRKKFSDLEIGLLKKHEINGDNAIKEKWRNFILPYEHRIAHYNFGTLVRLDASKDYTEDNTYFGTFDWLCIVCLLINLNCSHTNPILCHRNCSQS
jgi:hypothetical protein